LREDAEPRHVKALVVCSDAAVSHPTRPALYKRGYRFPPEIISHCVWLYYRFGVSLRDVSEMMLARGIEVSHEAILWLLKIPYVLRLLMFESSLDRLHPEDVRRRQGGRIVRKLASVARRTAA